MAALIWHKSPDMEFISPINVKGQSISASISEGDPRGGWSPSLGLELAFAEMLERPQAQMDVVSAPQAASRSSASVHPPAESSRTHETPRQNLPKKAESRPMSSPPITAPGSEPPR